MQSSTWAVIGYSTLAVIFITAAFFLSKAYGLTVTSPYAAGACPVYHLTVNVKINGQSVPNMMVDTGADFTVIGGSEVSRLGLDQLPTSTIIPNSVGMTSVTGQTQNLKAVDVTMQIENTKPFKAAVLIDPQTNFGSVISLHDLYQAYNLSLTPCKK